MQPRVEVGLRELRQQASKLVRCHPHVATAPRLYPANAHDLRRLERVVEVVAG